MSTNDLPPVTLLQQEIQSITSSMRRNQRWASTSAQQFATSQPPLPPYLQANKKRRAQGGLVPGPRPRRSKEGEQVEEGDLMGGFVELRRVLCDCRDIMQLTPLEAVSPFLALIRSPLTSGPITSLSLTSLHAIILNILPLHLTTPTRHVAPSTPLQVGLAHITSTLSSCRFPSSSPQQDELVLLRLLRVIEALALPLVYPDSETSPAAYVGSMLDHMGDESVCELLEVGLGMLARARLSEGLRSTAQSCVQTIVRAAFKRLKTLTPEDVEKLLQAAKEAEVEREKKEQVQAGGKAQPASPLSEKKALEAAALESGEENVAARASLDGSSKALERASIDTKGSVAASTVEQDQSPPPFTPYGLPTILELLRVLIALLNPSDQAHTDSMRYAALAVLNTALEVGGNGLGTWPELREGVRDEGCKYLFQLTRSDSSPLLAQSLRTTSTLFSTMLPHLKLQLELFLSYLIDRLTPPPSAPIPAHLQNISRPGTPAPNGGGEGDASQGGASLASEAATPTASTPKPMANLPPVPNETRELMLETLTQLAQRPGFMVDCWVNFDCSTDSEDIFERLIGFLSRGVYPIGPPKQDGSSNLFEGLDAAQLASLEVLLSYISAMSDRLDEGSAPWPSSAPPAESLQQRKQRKGVLIQGAAMFNAKPKNGLAFLEKEGIIAYQKETDGLEKEEAEKKRAVAVAEFLRSSSRLDKKEIGDYISRPDQVPLLTAFMRTFDFKGKSIADAMRELLETFRLPGEAQPIARITEVFAEVFFASGPPEIASQDAVYVLAYSVIMLNTDLHNPQNRKRMTIDDYKRNLRGVNDGKDFDPEYLAGIHESLKKKEIILPEEHSGSAGFEYAWKSLMQRTRTAGPMISCNTSLFDEAMFRRSWRPLIASIAYAFTMSAQDEHVIQRAITGFRQCATLAGHFGLLEVFDTIVLSLSTATGLLDNMADSDPATANFPVIDKDNQSLTISPLSVQFGQSYRSQLATVVLFAIAKSHAAAVRQGWLQIFEMFQTLFLHGLLPMPMLQMEDFLAGQTTIPMKTAAPADRRGDAAAAGGGLLSTLSSYLLSPYGASSENVGQMEVEEEDVENTLVAVDCLASCKLEELYGEVLNLPSAALVPALTSIRQLAESRSTARLARRKGALERGETGSPRMAHFEGQLPYDPACVFHLEMMVSLASRQRGSIAETWPIIFEYIASLLNSAQHYSVLLTERAVVGLLRLCLIVSETPALRDQLYIALDILRSLPSSVLANVSEQLMAGIAKILEKDSSVVRSQTEWGLIIALFRATANHPEASKVTLAIVQKMVNEQSGPEITADNWKGVVDLLDEFATAAGWANATSGVRRPGMQQQQHQRQGSQKQALQLAPVVERGMAALESLYELQHFVPRLSKEIPPNDIWHALWFPVLSIMSKHTVNPVREIRQRSISYLQRVLLSPSLLNADQATLPFVFDKILFPIMDEVLKPASMERDPGGFAETRTKAATAMCKAFLQYHVNLGPEQVGLLFGRLLDRMERFMKGERDMLNEAGESLKNLILVMHSSGLLVPPPVSGKAEEDGRTEEQKKLWAESGVKIERVLPGFAAETLTPAQPVVRKSVEAAAPVDADSAAPAASAI